MSQNTVSTPYLLQLNDTVNGVAISENITIVPNNKQICLQGKLGALNGNVMEVQAVNVVQAPPVLNFVYEVVSPEELNLKPVICGLKRGRPKKPKSTSEPVGVTDAPKIVRPAPRTRSGRVVKFPKHIEKDFKKIITCDESQTQEDEVKTTEFAKFVDDPRPATNDTEQLQFHQKKRKISAQYRCPKCNKAYLGKNKMIEHIKKNPAHGPLPDGYSTLNFDVWNHLVDITQKCAPSERAAKFCDELTNLLHNLVLLTGALFKKCEAHKNEVTVDKVLGNAIGLSPGAYSFDDSKLYKDVTVLKLISDSEFFKPPICDDKNAENAKNLDKFYYDNTSKDVFDGQKDIFKSSNGKNPVASDLLSENLLNTLPALILPEGTNILDNSSSSDEVMNVDQFVIERFKKITEPEGETTNSTLNLDLPSLDLFNFHTS